MKNCLALFVLISANLFGQQALDEQVNALNAAMAGYERDFKSLAQTRGFNYLEGDFTMDKLSWAISRFSQTSGAAGGKQFRFLFYYHRSDSLNIWLLNHAGSAEVHVRFFLRPDSLLILENTIKHAIHFENMMSAANRGTYRHTSKKYRLNRNQSVEKLSRILLPPTIAEKLVGIRYLCILPVLNISSIPFGMLQPWHSQGHVVDSLAYSFVYNMREFLDSVDPAGREPFHPSEGEYELRSPLIVGNPAFTDSCTRTLAPLPGAEAEARAVANLVGATALIGSAATRQAVMQGIQQSSFIYLATHGYADPEDAMHKSYVALSQPGECGLITPAEIQQLTLQRDAMVMLSACETGNGLVADAGMIGLARGFLKAGAKSVLMSLWDVDDEQTRLLMLLAMEELGKEQPFFPAENFRQAVLRYRKLHSDDPSYWAAFQLFGTPLRLSNRVSLHQTHPND